LPFEIYAENEKSRFNDFRKVYLHKKRLNPDLLISERGQPGFLHDLLRHHCLFGRGGNEYQIFIP
jgi:hypothetical protein